MQRMLIAVALLVPCLYADREACADAPARPDIAGIALQLKAVEHVQKLLQAAEYCDVSSMPHRWRENLPAAVQKAIIIELLRHLESEKELVTRNTLDVTIPSRVAAAKMKWMIPGVIIEQDFFLVNGRCAFAIENMLRWHLPHFGLGLTRKELQARIEEAHFKVIEGLSLPNGKGVSWRNPVNELPDGMDNEPRVDAEHKARQAVRHLRQVHDYATLKKLAKEWRDDSDEVRIMMVVELLKRLDSRSALKLTNYRNLVLPRAGFGLSKYDSKSDEDLILQDIVQENGRCAWAMQEILSCDLPVFHAGMTKLQRAASIEETYWRVLQAMGIPDRPGAR
jgi:hypothetical protein